MKLKLGRVYLKWLHWIWAGFILFATIANTRTLEQILLSELFAYDKPIHVFLFGIQTMLLLAAYFIRPYSHRTILNVIAMVVSYGFITELLQILLTTSRQFDYLDLVANTVGCLISAYIAFKWNPKTV